MAKEELIEMLGKVTEVLPDSRYRVTLDNCGQLTGAYDKIAGRELAGNGLNDFGGCTTGTLSAENVGPVSATLRADITGTPNRRVRVTLYKDVSRIEIGDNVLECRDRLLDRRDLHQFPARDRTAAILQRYDQVAALLFKLNKR